ncbi:VOC family protein [Undibacterium terreum]|uniref:Glyoxalase/bleomycin resistance protein/dioxygenase superfamily protein n=1 Tax=Undibacterium terreum TaxID=1224302 RepID=A0A916XN18_9BURK|nr:VOC family protein [Undibacterium terreum]GGC85340.1 glyoxalase/bleomycin resistance protein/dioxygenase superfamily protein [Undibacterium terreum]
MQALHPFHLAFFVRDLDEARKFYGGILGFTEGRSTERWVDFDCLGHQLSMHLKADLQVAAQAGMVDGDNVPIPHYGVILDMSSWQALADRVSAANIPFIVQPHVRFKGEPGEQSTMFFCDPSGNALEFKGFAEINKVFAK